MITTAERRLALLQILCERREETINNLAFELRVSRNTIKTDIFVLSLSYPIYTVQGRGGGVRILDGYCLGMKYLTDKQSNLLERLLEKTEGADRELLHTIIQTFRRPNVSGRK
jgi:predicted DNA-binding transcriptional regulator YafY